MGDKNRIVHNFGDGSLDKIMKDIDQGKIKKNKSWSATHPAYYGTSIQQKEPIKPIRCEKCIYFREPATGLKKRCQFPWNDPQEYDKAIIEFLPCKGVKP